MFLPLKQRELLTMSVLSAVTEILNRLSSMRWSSRESMSSRKICIQKAKYPATDIAPTRIRIIRVVIIHLIPKFRVKFTANPLTSMTERKHQICTTCALVLSRSLSSCNDYKIRSDASLLCRIAAVREANIEEGTRTSLPSETREWTSTGDHICEKCKSPFGKGLLYVIIDL